MHIIQPLIQDIVTWAEEVKDISRQMDNNEAANSIQQEIDALKTGKFMLAVMGKVKRGKSTFCNAFLGRTDNIVAPIDKLPASSVVTKFIYDENEKVVVYYRDGHQEVVGYNQIAKFVTESGNPENKLEVDSVEVYGPFGGLDQQLVLVDTPGAGSIHKHHDAILHGFIPKADAVIFLVTANMPLAADEVELLKELKSHDIQKIFFAINKVDDCEEQDINDGIEHNLKILAEAGISVSNIHRISAKNALNGNSSISGVPEMLDCITSFLNENQIKIIRSRFISKVSRIVEGLATNVAIQIESDSKSVQELEAEQIALSKRKEEINSDRGHAEKEFTFKWRSAIEDLKRVLPGCQRKLKEVVSAHIHATGVLQVDALRKSLPTFIANTRDEVLSKPFQDFEEQARKATEKLRAEYPAVSMSQDGSLTLRSGGKHENLLVTGSLGGAVAAATGMATVAAASGMTASIAAANAAAIAATAAAAHAAAGVAAFNTVAGLGATVVGTVLTGPLGAALGMAGTGLMGAAPTVAAPVLATAPAWLALAGPIGWTLAGAGVLIVPFAYRSSKLKQKDQLETESIKFIDGFFEIVFGEHIKHLSELSERIVTEFSLQLDNELIQIEKSLQKSILRKEELRGIDDLVNLSSRLCIVKDYMSKTH